jgi:8-oxo-dGTP diphosphatase/2-hydroxy-dATP diphosphatase
MKKLLTLCLATRGNKVLLGMKKRGFGMGKWNGFGGKIEKGETIEEATKREMFEESGVSVSQMEKVGIHQFTFEATPDEVLEVHVFHATEFSGNPEESEEMHPAWFAVNELPFRKMWADDEYWFPLFLAGKKFTGEFHFDERHKIIKKELKIVEFL